MAEPDADREFEKRARLAVVWQDLVTPVRAIVGYGEIVVEEARRLQLADLSSDLGKVLVAAGALMELVDRLHDPRFELAEAADDGLGGIQAKLRHDLRTPLNAIIGYSEMVIEDLDSLPGSEAVRSDLEKVLEETRALLDRIDTIVDLGRSGPAPEDGRDPAAGAATDRVIAGLLRTLHLDPALAKPNELGRILAVDDNASNRDLLCRRLTLEGHEVVAASSGAEALQILENEAFDLILLDLLMPDMNGIEVLVRLKGDTRWRDTPVIMISGLTETDAVIRCIEAGAEDYLPKPFNLVLLRARISASLERNRWRAREREYLASLQIEKDRSEALLRNILPDPVVIRLNAGEKVIADRFENVSILFADIVGFTYAAASMTPSRLVDRLNAIFTEFDILAAELGVEKIKTIGDSYMAATGLPEAQDEHAEIIAAFGLKMLSALQRLNAAEPEAPFQLRIGIHCGPVVAGVIGRRKFIYDVWGDTVNLASRMESNGVPGRIQVSESVRDALQGKYRFESRGAILLKGKGDVEAFLLIPPVAEHTDPAGPSAACELR